VPTRRTWSVFSMTALATLMGFFTVDTHPTAPGGGKR
jgi:hypothetical protein